MSCENSPAVDPLTDQNSEFAADMKALKGVMKAYVGEDMPGLASHKTMKNMEKVTKKVRFRLQIRQLEYYHRGKRYQNAIVERAIFICGTHGPHSDGSCRYQLHLMRYLREEATVEKEQNF